MDARSELQHSAFWRTAVWALRVGYCGLAIAFTGLIVLLSGSAPWLLAVGMIIWLSAVAVTLFGFVQARRELPEPRMRLWSMRMALLHDSVHARPS